MYENKKIIHKKIHDEKNLISFLFESNLLNVGTQLNVINISILRKALITTYIYIQNIQLLFLNLVIVKHISQF